MKFYLAEWRLDEDPGVPPILTDHPAGEDIWTANQAMKARLAELTAMGGVVQGPLNSESNGYAVRLSNPPDAVVAVCIRIKPSPWWSRLFQRLDRWLESIYG